MRLYRPYTPVDIRLQVIEHQVRERYGFCPETPSTRSNKMLRLGALLNLMFGDQKVELHHRPALCNRERGAGGDYVPRANDPDYLIYVTKADHDIETRVRGIGAQHSDLGLLRKRKRIERKKIRALYKKLVPKKTKGVWGKVFRTTMKARDKEFKRRWPKRKFPRRKK